MLLQYQTKAEPVKVEPRLESWYQPTSMPVAPSRITLFDLPFIAEPTVVTEQNLDWLRSTYAPRLEPPRLTPFGLPFVAEPWLYTAPDTGWLAQIVLPDLERNVQPLYLEPFVVEPLMVGNVPTAAVIGGNDANCVLLLHCDGDDDGTAFADESQGGRGKTITLVDTARTVTAQVKFGHTSLLCDGGGACLRLGECADWNLGTADWSVDLWAYIRDAGRPRLFAWYLNPSNYLALEGASHQGDAVRLRLRYRSGGVDLVDAVGTSYVTVADEWHHLAVVREGATISVYVDGVLHAQGGGASASMNFTTYRLWIGSNGTLAADAYIDEFRVSTSARWSTNFSVATNAYSAPFHRDARGTFHTYAGTLAEARGTHGVVYHPFLWDARGTHYRYAETVQEARGRHHVYAGTVGEARGAYGVNLRPFRQDARGRHQVRAVTVQEARGLAQWLSGPFYQEARGLAQLRREYQQDARGEATLLRAYGSEARGRHRIEDNTLVRYELYYGDGSVPDLTAAPWQTFTSFPFETPAISGEGKHYFVLRRRNKYGLLSYNTTSTVIELDDGDEQIVVVPSGPDHWSMAADAGGKVRVRGTYLYGRDAAAAKADQWLIYLTDDGDDPDPGVDEPTVVDMVQIDGVVKLNWLSSAFANEATIKVLLRTRRSGTGGRDSIDATIKSATASTTGPAPPTLGGQHYHGDTPVGPL